MGTDSEKEALISDLTRLGICAISYSWMNKRKLLTRIANSPKSARFDEIVTLLIAFGFHLSRVKGSHHIFVHPEISELVNLQEVHGEAKAYQVRQFLKIVERHNLTLEEER